MTLAMLLLGLLPGLLKVIPGISDRMQQLIADISGSTAVVLASGVISSPNVNTVLSAWAGIIGVLKLDPKLPANMLNAIAQLEKAVQAALTEDAESAKLVDWSKIVTVATV
jgi:hypothetical protein